LRLKILADEITAFDRSLRQINAELSERPARQKQLADLQSKVTLATEARLQVETLAARRNRQLDALQTDRAQRTALEAEAAQLAAKAVDAENLQNALDKLRFEARVAAEALGGARQRLSALDALAKYRTDKTAARNKLADEQGIFDELREAFSKKGVPAMIIEAAVPEIENAANVDSASSVLDVRFHYLTGRSSSFRLNQLRAFSPRTWRNLSSVMPGIFFTSFTESGNSESQCR